MNGWIIASGLQVVDDLHLEDLMLDLLCITIAFCFLVDSALLVHWSDRVR